MISLRPYAIGLKENQSDLLDKLNLSLKSVIIDGRYEKIYQKWFKTKPYKFPNRYLE
jgi:ABC-type amino acid transport substrate-binding protein